AERVLGILSKEPALRCEQVEVLVQKRLRREGFDVASDEAAPPNDEPAPEAKEAPREEEAKPPAAQAKKRKRGRAAAGACEGCGTVNDADAMFCKKCGARVKAIKEEDAS